MTRRTLLGGGVCLASAAGLLLYGGWRMGQQTTHPGPAIGLVQQAFPISLSREDHESQEIFDAHVTNSLRLAGQGCDLVVWPESMLGFGNMDPAWSRLDADARDPTDASRPAHSEELRSAIRTYQKNLGALSTLMGKLGCPVLAGGAMPAARTEDRGVRCNSALLYDRDRRNRVVLRQRYDKMQLVPFSECVPFRRGWPWLHERLRGFVPTVMAQLEPGDRPVWFRISSGGQPFELAAPICFEGTFGRLCREMVMDGRRKRAHLLVNLSNDGWFVYRSGDTVHAGTELDQHLVQYVFRAVESRVPVVRAVNTGISAHIDSTGAIRGAVAHLGRRRMVAGNLVARTLVDDRVSIYSLFGDVFALVVSASAGVMTVVVCRPRRGVAKETVRKGKHGKK